jgi:hypothetical protein
MNVKQLLRNIALQVHLLHERAYTYWLARESGIQLLEPLTFEEREFFVQLKNELSNPDLI